MSVSLARSGIKRVQTELARLRSNDAAEAKRESNIVSKINAANNSASKASSNSSQQNYLRNAERCYNEQARIIEKRARIANDIAQKTGELYRYQDQLSTAENRERENVNRENERFTKSLEQRQNLVRRSLDNQMLEVSSSITANQIGPLAYDVFMCHASEDKGELVSQLATELQNIGLKVWYDDFVLNWGDSLRRKIDEGLANSRCGIVVLSPHFFQKEWTQRELDGLVVQEELGNSRIFPVWHKITKDELASFSPTLADKLALSTSTHTIKEIAKQFQAIFDELHYRAA